MKKFLDKNGKELTRGLPVNVPDPNDDDIHQHAFLGSVDSFRGQNVIVIDSEGEFYEIEPERLTIFEVENFEHTANQFDTPDQ